MDGSTTTLVLGDHSASDPSNEGGCLVQIFGDGLGRRIELHEGELSLGRDEDNDVVLALDSVSRRHCAIRCESGLVLVRDLGSTNGTRVRDERLQPNESVELSNGDLVQMGSVIFKFLRGGDIEAHYHDEIYRSSVVDALTGLYNRRYLVDHLKREIARSQRHGRPLSLILFDVDHFKAINDEHGHAGGDQVLRELAELVGANVRREDCCARYGGEEFAISSTENGLEASCLVAEKLRGLVEAHSFSFNGTVIPVTISIGVSLLAPQMTEPAELIDAADAHMYEAKRLGRNRVAS